MFRIYCKDIGMYYIDSFETAEEAQKIIEAIADCNGLEDVNEFEIVEEI